MLQIPESAIATNVSSIYAVKQLECHWSFKHCADASRGPARSKGTPKALLQSKRLSSLKTLRWWLSPVPVERNGWSRSHFLVDCDFPASYPPSANQPPNEGMIMAILSADPLHCVGVH
ncbi:unnamed protein product [Schistocephalus solidus]|uniref:UBC core domain-containing protein n=1 Tax=Schistocephalus solidus TaxID=70667 RepID=A0A183STP7_SCHSO|nr:unnamed protein product [Schistocephalus solidus]